MNSTLTETGSSSVSNRDRWNLALGIEASFPAEHSEYLDRCHRHGQTRPTPEASSADTPIRR
jgi:hypothetical protein